MLEKIKTYESSNVMDQLPVVWDRAKGYQVYDRWGNCWIDFTSTIFVANAGHGNENVIQRLREQLDKPLLHSYSYATSIRADFLEKLIQEDPFIQFIYIVDTEGRKVTKNITQAEYREEFEKKGLDADFSTREWFVQPMKSGESHVTNLYTSKITGNLCMTVSAPIRNKKKEIIGILGIDMKFEDLAKL